MTKVVLVSVLARTMTHSDDDDDDEVSVLEGILGRQVDQREDTVCDEDGVDVSVGLDVVQLWVLVSMIMVSV